MMSPENPAVPAQESKSRGWIWLIALLIAVVLVIVLLEESGGSKPPPHAAGIPVTAVPARSGDLDVTLDALGTVTPVATVTVSSRVAGAIAEVDYKEGQAVKKGDLLVVIDPKPYAAAVVQAQGQLARDQAILKNARVDLARYQDAFHQHAIPEQQLATQQAVVDQDDGMVKIDEGNRDAAQVNLDYTRIVSPIDGRVGLRLLDAGNIVEANAGTALVTITQLEPITVIFNVAEDDLGLLAGPGANALRVDALDRAQEHVLATGQLITIDNEINPATGTFRGRAIFANAHGELFPNQFVNARVHVKTLHGATLVPAAAIQRNGDAAFVYAIVDGKAVSRPIGVAATAGDTAAVTGVKPGDVLVTDGFDRLQNGASVTLRKTAPAGAAAAPAAGG